MGTPHCNRRGTRLRGRLGTPRTLRAVLPLKPSLPAVGPFSHLAAKYLSGVRHDISLHSPLRKKEPRGFFWFAICGRNRLKRILFSNLISPVHFHVCEHNQSNGFPLKMKYIRQESLEKKKTGCTSSPSSTWGSRRTKADRIRSDRRRYRLEQQRSAALRSAEQHNRSD